VPKLGSNTPKLHFTARKNHFYTPKNRFNPPKHCLYTPNDRFYTPKNRPAASLWTKNRPKTVKTARFGLPTATVKGQSLS
jgi:hypothetical protein